MKRIIVGLIYIYILIVGNCYAQIKFKSNFTFQTASENYACGLDKIGHGYGAYIITRTCGSTCGLIIPLLSELSDGFRKCGFSKQDEIAHLIGWAVGMLYNTSDIADYMEFKISIQKIDKQEIKEINPNYDNHTYWVVIKHHKFPEYIPNLCLGIKTHGYHTKQVKPVFLVGIDFDITLLLNKIPKVFNIIHLGTDF